KYLFSEKNFPFFDFDDEKNILSWALDIHREPETLQSILEARAWSKDSIKDFIIKALKFRDDNYNTIAKIILLLTDLDFISLDDEKNFLYLATNYIPNTLRYIIETRKWSKDSIIETVKEVRREYGDKRAILLLEDYAKRNFPSAIPAGINASTADTESD